MSGDAYHITAPSSDGDGGFRAMKAALQDSNLTENQIDYINAHGTSTPLGDMIELKAVKKLFKSKLPIINVGTRHEISIKELSKFQPEIIHFCEESLKDSIYDLDFLRLDKKSFEKCPNISIDKSVMEKTNLGIVTDLDSGWSDIGSWESVWEISKKDTAQSFL